MKRDVHKHCFWKHGKTIVYVMVVYDGFVLKWINSIQFVEQDMLVSITYSIVTFPNSSLFITPTVIRCTFCMRCMAPVVRSPRHNQPSDPNPPSKEPMDNMGKTKQVLLLSLKNMYQHETSIHFSLSTFFKVNCKAKKVSLVQPCRG